MELDSVSGGEFYNGSASVLIPVLRVNLQPCIDTQIAILLTRRRGIHFFEVKSDHKLDMCFPMLGRITKSEADTGSHFDNESKCVVWMR